LIVFWAISGVIAEKNKAIISIFLALISIYF
jgi:hypothetical protein